MHNELEELIEWYSDILYAFIQDVEESLEDEREEKMREGVMLARHAVGQLKKLALRGVNGNCEKQGPE